MKKLGFATLLALAVFASNVSAAPVKDDAAVKRALDDEMQRAMTKLRLGSEAPPYYVSYTVVDDDVARVSARLGALVGEDHNPSRSLRVDVRVGSYDDDNTNFRGSFGGHGSAMVSRDDDYTGLRRDLWEITDRQYKQALESFARKKASKTIETAEKDKMPDFAKITPVTSVTDKAAAPTDADRAKMKDTVQKLSAIFREFPTVNSGRVDGLVGYARRRMMTSEKTWTDEREARVRIDVHADTTTPDGHHLDSSLSFTSTDVASLPSVEKMTSDVRALAKNLADQRTAPAVEAGSASVVFEGEAAAQVAKMLLSQPLSGQPEPKSADSGPRDGSLSFADRIGLKVAPQWLTVTDDPHAVGANKKPLCGSYDTDDEGVPGEKLTMIDHGVVKTLFMSRTPRKEIPKSNGHGRGGWGVHAGQSNLFVHADGGLPRAQLLQRAVQSAGPKGTVYLVKQLEPSGGLARGQVLTARVAFRLKDGKEEPVRGLSLEGFVPKKMKKDLVAAGTDSYLLEEDGFAGTSTTAPSLLFEDVDISKPNDKSKMPPLYASPLEAMK